MILGNTIYVYSAATLNYVILYCIMYAYVAAAAAQRSTVYVLIFYVVVVNLHCMTD